MASSRWTRWMVPVAFAGAVLLALPWLNSPLLQDDVVHRAMLADQLPGLHWGPLDLYDFVGSADRPARALRDAGAMPWFVSEDLRLRFFRPFSSATLAFDASLFGNHLWLARLHSLAWFLLLLSIVSGLHRRMLPDQTAGLATVIYAVALGHLMPVSWLAARHELVAAAFGALAFLLHVRTREDAWRPGRVLAPLTFCAGLLAGELVVGACALIAAWELIGRRDRLTVRAAALAPFGLVLAGYVLFYASMGYGAHGSSVYIGFDAGLAGMVTIARRFLLLVAELVAATPSDAFSLQDAATQTTAAIWGLVSAITAALVIFWSRSRLHARESAAVGWMAAAAAAAALPGALSLVGGRVLTLALLPAAGVMAVVIARGALAMRDTRHRPETRVILAMAALGFGVGHLIAAPTLRIAIGSVLDRLAERSQAIAAQTPTCGGTLVIVATSDPSLATYLAPTLILQGRAPERFHVLSMAAADHRIENVTETGFDLIVPPEERTFTVWERLYRNSGLPAGTGVTITGLDITVIEDAGGAPTRVRFDFGEPLDSPNLCLTEWRDGSLRRLPAPAPGDVVPIPHEPGPMGW